MLVLSLKIQIVCEQLVNNRIEFARQAGDVTIEYCLSVSKVLKVKLGPNLERWLKLKSIAIVLTGNLLKISAS